MLDVAVVILNWNGIDFLKKFLPGVLEHTYINERQVDVIVVDNASTDGSIEFLRNEFPRLQIIQLSKNYGFAKGYDLALKKIRARYFVLLNSDVETPKEWLEPLYSFMEKNTDVAVTMPKIKWQIDKSYFEYAGAGGGFMDKFGYTFCQGRIFNTLEKDNGQYDKLREIFWASGACFMIRSVVYFKAGGLDHRFFAHMEEIDLCWRIHRIGYKVVYIPRSEVYHVGGGTLPSTSPLKTFLNFRNNLVLLYKNLPSKNLFFRILQRLILDFVAALHLISKGNMRSFFSVFKAYWKFYSMLPELRNERVKANNNFKINEDIIYPRSIVFDYFVKKKKYFSELKH